jgi:hypothetical protein
MHFVIKDCRRSITLTIFKNNERWKFLIKEYKQKFAIYKWIRMPEMKNIQVTQYKIFHSLKKYCPINIIKKYIEEI